MDNGQGNPPSHSSDPSGDKNSSIGAGAGWAVLSTLISGMLVWGGFGWLVDRWLGTRFALPIGIVLGMAGAVVLIVRRYSKISPPDDNDQ